MRMAMADFQVGDALALGDLRVVTFLITVLGCARVIWAKSYPIRFVSALEAVISQRTCAQGLFVKITSYL